MNKRKSDFVPKKSEKRFVEALMKNILDGAMIPKLQIERTIGPILSFFLEGVLSKKLDASVVMLSPEFPIRKNRLLDSDKNYSTNIDWLMMDSDKKELLLVELKTSDTSLNKEQMEVYKKLQELIAEKRSSSFLVDELGKIASASQEHGKYKNIMLMIADALGIDGEAEGFEDLLRKELSQYKKAKLIYLAPKVSKPKDWVDSNDVRWFSFEDLPHEIDHAYADNWRDIRDSLQMLDFHSKKVRNGEEKRNYSFRLPLKDMLERCRTEGNKIKIGLIDWENKMKLMTADDLKSRPYKGDYVDYGIGVKVEKKLDSRR
ncbi:MAG: hypothetical protein Q4A28_00865 [Brachymonas sp.]|nr:hypothetical protein [Brachymonas sp.]